MSHALYEDFPRARTMVMCLLSISLVSGCPTSGDNHQQDMMSMTGGETDSGLTSPGEDLGAEADDGTSMASDMTGDASLSADLGHLADMCVDTTVHIDEDGDGYGVAGDGSMQVCLVPGAPAPDGYQVRAGDCKDDDPLAHDMAEGICNDNVDDDCDGVDEACPTSQPDQMSVPSWDCAGSPPTNVYAWAKFEDGKGYFKDGGCFVFFEGKKDVFYVTRHLFRENTDPNCDKINGCVCPSLNGWPSYDRRLYAFSLRGTPERCDPISLRDHAGEEQVVSNSCRKYLYQLHFYDIPYSYVSSSLDALDERLTRFDRVEIACAEDAPHANLPFASLLTTTIEYNDDFVKQ